MKYWRGYLVGAIFLAISWALIAFAKAHGVLVDMIYPYMARLVMTNLATWSGGVSFCVWQILLLTLIVAGIVSVILMIVLHWNFVQWGGWVAACICFLSLCNTVLFGLTPYTGPLAEDIRLEITDYTADELAEAAAYFRDQANTLSGQFSRNRDGEPEYADFDTLAKNAGDGFRVLTYDKAISVFAGSTVPVKKSGGLANAKTVPLTGECCVNPDVRTVMLPYVMCMEMSRRMCIDREADNNLAAFLACKYNPSPEFQYTANCVAYYYCHHALENLPTKDAERKAEQLTKGQSPSLTEDLRSCKKVLGTPDRLSEETDTADLLTCWYIQEFITPLHKQEELPFDPMDPAQVDLTYVPPVIPDE